MYKFVYGENIKDMEDFHTMMYVKYPDIIGRKHFCIKKEEITDALIKDCALYNVKIEGEL